jgi:hypothetical protein
MQRFSRSSLLDDSRFVVRAVETKKPFYIPPDFDHPLPNLFYPSDPDIAEGEKNSQQPLVSVWDAELSLEDILTNRRLTTSNSRAYILSVREIHSLAPMSSNSAPVEVHSKPSQGPGVLRGDLHCGIQGLYREDPTTSPQPTRKERDRLVSNLLQLCVKHPELQ